MVGGGYRCTVHPSGEQAERRAALDAGTPYARPFEHRELPPLRENPNADDLVRRALLVNAELEARYWEWRAAIEQIPQDGTQPTNLALFGGLDITKGAVSREGTTVGLGNDPMADILLPPKLSHAARRALENARAAGFRFRKTQFELRAKVLSAYADYALSAELLRLERSNAELLQTAMMVVEAKNRTGLGGQQDLLRARNELDLSRNDVANLESQLPARRAALNALVGRPADADLLPPAALPLPRPIAADDAEVLSLVAARNPEMLALSHELKAQAEGVRLAGLQYLPDVSLSAGTDLSGVTQSLAGMVTAPVLRYEAIRAAVAQAEAKLRAGEAMRRQAGNDLSAQVVSDLTTVRDADRQLALAEGTILPRARQAVIVSRSSYEAGRASLIDLIDAQRSLIAIERLAATLRASREKRLADLETMSARSLTI